MRSFHEYGDYTSNIKTQNRIQIPRQSSLTQIAPHSSLGITSLKELPSNTQLPNHQGRVISNLPPPKMMPNNSKMGLTSQMVTKSHNEIDRYDLLKKQELLQQYRYASDEAESKFLTENAKKTNGNYFERKSDLPPINQSLLNSGHQVYGFSPQPQKSNFFSNIHESNQSIKIPTLYQQPEARRSEQNFSSYDHCSFVNANTKNDQNLKSTQPTFEQSQLQTQKTNHQPTQSQRISQNPHPVQPQSQMNHSNLTQPKSQVNPVHSIQQQVHKNQSLSNQQQFQTSPMHPIQQQPQVNLSNSTFQQANANSSSNLYIQPRRVSIEPLKQSFSNAFNKPESKEIARAEPKSFQVYQMKQAHPDIYGNSIQNEIKIPENNKKHEGNPMSNSMTSLGFSKINTFGDLNMQKKSSDYFKNLNLTENQQSSTNASSGVRNSTENSLVNKNELFQSFGNVLAKKTIPEPNLSQTSKQPLNSPLPKPSGLTFSENFISTQPGVRNSERTLSPNLNSQSQRADVTKPGERERSKSILKNKANGTGKTVAESNRKKSVTIKEENNTEMYFKKYLKKMYSSMKRIPKDDEPTSQIDMGISHILNKQEPAREYQSLFPQ